MEPSFGTFIIMIGTKKQKEIFSNQMKEAQTDKWLGQQISAKGLADSV